MTMKNITKGMAHEFYRDLKGTIDTYLKKGNSIDGFHKMMFPYISIPMVAELMGIDQDKAKLLCESMVIKSHDSERFYEYDGTVLYLVQ